MLSSTFLRITLIICFGGLLALGLVGPTLAQGQQAPHALVLRVDGIINPVKERLISRTIEQAEEGQATLVIIQLDTPGGLLDSTRKIVEMMLEADVPIAVYVSPRGAQAGSAGTFITAAANFAVMAPATNIGAATPVSATGENLNETLANKATNDAAALIRSIAQVRGRNAEKLEETVREAASFSAREAVELNIADFIATDLEDLLAQLDGRVVETNAGTITLDTQDVELRRVEKTFLEHFLEFISDPNVSFILITVGSLGIIVELFNPGLIVPGVVGAISLLLAFLALGNLPFNWAGVAFIILAIVLMVLEILVAGFGILGIGAVISFIVGGLLLFAQFGGGSPTLPPISVNLWLLGGVAGVLALGLLFVARTIQQSRRPGSQLDTPSLVGATGRVTAKLAPRGAVWVRNENWTAVSEDGNVIGVGEPVRVTKVDGLVLTVSRHQQVDTQS
jgi:membrane-bound serine protease (ClpP class)